MTDPAASLAYKYASFERIKYFEDELLRFSQPGALNDPFECYPGMDIEFASMLIEQYEDPAPVIAVTKETFDDILVPYLTRIANRLNSRIGMLCLSARWDSTLMWSHYSNDHRGFCIGFDVNHPFFSTDYIAEGGWGPIQQVNYSANRHFVSLKKLAPHEVLALLTTKHVDWSYEKELRLIRELNEGEQVNEAADAMPIVLFRVPHAAVREIYAGAKAPQALKDTLRTHAERLNAKFYETHMAIDRYDLRRWPL